MRWIAVLALLIGLAGCTPTAPPGFVNTDITGSPIGRSLGGVKDDQGRARTLADFHGKALVLFFGYTSCPDVCPTTLSRLVEVRKKLGSDADRVQVVLVTVDPERDTPARLAAYVKAFNPSFIGLSGSPAETEAIAREFKVFFTRRAAGHHHGAPSDYAMDHSTGMYVFDPAGRIRLYIKNDAASDAIAHDLKRLLAAG